MADSNRPLQTPSFTPICPNHGEPLEGCGFPLPKKGVGICPVSKCSFEFEVELDEAEVVRDKDGGVQKKVGWSITGDEV